LELVRALIVLAAVLLTCCGPAPKPVAQAEKDPTSEEWYLKAVGALQDLNRDAEKLYQAGKFDEAGALVTNGQQAEQLVLSVSRPSLAALQAASDLDQLYGRMLLRNRHYGWARLLFQKNLSRWKKWSPVTEDSARRLKLAEDGIAECDRGLAK
jgi:hypothetical protein